MKRANNILKLPGIDYVAKKLGTSHDVKGFAIGSFLECIVKEAMEYKLERLNTTLIRSIYNTHRFTTGWCTAREPDLQQIYERLARKSRDVLST